MKSEEGNTLVTLEISHMILTDHLQLQAESWSKSFLPSDFMAISWGEE